MAKSETEGEQHNASDVVQKGTNSAELTLRFENGSVKTYKVTGVVQGDLETGAFKIENENGSKFVFLPNPEFHTGKRKRKLKMLYNL